MTGPVTTEALRTALARSAIEAKFGPEGVSVIFDTPDEATDHQRAVLAARAEEARRVADFAIAGPLAPLLAALQQVTAERDEARKEASDLQNDWADEVAASRRETERADAAEASLATATSELARLRAEGEAKDRALKAATDKLEAVCSAISVAAEWERAAERSAQREDERLRRNPLIRGAVEAARAATAREG